VADTHGGARNVFAICEVSSFQSETLQHFRADATLWTNFAEDHLERHRGLEGYFGAKWKLVAHTKTESGTGSQPVSPKEQRPEAGATVFAGSSVQRYAQKFDRPAARVVAVPTEN